MNRHLYHQLTRMESRGLVTRSAVDGGVLVHADAVRKHLFHRIEGLDQTALVQVLEQLTLDAVRT